ncbi:hypothetical protein L3X38_037282 [Prunus dulcis]|uniref:Uncharacterized protein n=1 Tax=Prunus dulcis TaxID=3755 RepID=A0AAD4YQH8_PRUDU|nr:hypothetical protein L3X38_037282 [Prunus dulcis]
MQHAGNTQAARRQIVQAIGWHVVRRVLAGRVGMVLTDCASSWLAGCDSCWQFCVGSYIGNCEEKFQQMCSDIKGMSGQLRMVMAEWHACDASCGEGNVSGRSGWLPCTFVGIQHGMMACHGLDIDTWRQEQKGSLENRSSLVP